MFDEKVILPEQLPAQEKSRKITDCCCTIVGAIFALTMFIVACCMWNKCNSNFNNSASFDSLYSGATSKSG
jgi:hypothetical protein